MEVQVRDESRADGGDDILVPFEDVREHLVVVGNGMAGCRAVEELLARDAGRYRVTIFGAEPHVNYNRIMLSPVLAGEKTFDQALNDPAPSHLEQSAQPVQSGDQLWFQPDFNPFCLRCLLFYKAAQRVTGALQRFKSHDVGQKRSSKSSVCARVSRSFIAGTES